MLVPILGVLIWLYYAAGGSDALSALDGAHACVARAVGLF